MIWAARLTSASTLTAGQWHHAAVTYDGTTLSLYLDGSLTAESDRTLEASDGGFVVGANRTQRRISLRVRSMNSSFTTTC